MLIRSGIDTRSHLYSAPCELEWYAESCTTGKPSTGANSQQKRLSGIDTLPYVSIRVSVQSFSRRIDISIYRCTHSLDQAEILTQCYWNVPTRFLIANIPF